MLIATEAAIARARQLLLKNATRDVEIWRGDITNRHAGNTMLWSGKANRFHPRAVRDGLRERAPYDNTEYAYLYQLIDQVEIDTEIHYLVDTTLTTDSYWELIDETHGGHDISTWLRVRDLT